MDEKLISEIVERILEQVSQNTKDSSKINSIPVEASGRHIHLSEEDALELFGKVDLTIVRELSQPGQYLYKEKVMLIGPKGVLKEVAILGPCRGATQVEISITDARALGVKAITRDSGNLDGASDLVVMANGKVIDKKAVAIIAKRHIHMTPEDAVKQGVKDQDMVAIRVYGERNVIFENVLVRVDKRFKLSMHLDFDEANAVGLNSCSYGEIIK